MRTTSDADGTREPISITVIRRIPEYLNVVRRLREEGLEWVSSEELAQACGMKPSSVRTDLGYFGKFGLTRRGYDVVKLNHALEQILGIDRTFHMAIVGAGHMGQAIANHENFRKRGFHVKAILDSDPKVIGRKVAGLVVLPIDQLADVVKREKVELGAICVPAANAQWVTDRLVAAGIAGIWNFAPVQLVVPAEVAVEDVHLSANLLTLGYRVKERRKQPEGQPAPPRVDRKAAPRSRYGAQKVRP